MIATKIVWIFGLFALQSASGSRLARSPDKMEVDIPNHSLERESEEYQDSMREEALYWQEQGDKLEEKENEGHEQINEDRDKNQEQYEHEKDYYQEQQHNYNNEVNQTYQEDRDKTEAHHHDNQEHYEQHHNDNYQPNTNKTAQEITETETGDRYEEKGTEFYNENEDKIQNYDVNGDSPSITYTKT